jgi:phenylpropionate dioxygenase-like ring-hydroxylating dioxygenase large terminal subunit
MRERTESGALNYDYLIQSDKVEGLLYTSDEVFNDELERIWYKTWVFVGHASEIPNPGDYISRNIGLQPVIMVRDRDGSVNVFYNRCTHRGTKLCNRLSGNSRALVCPYHGWAFDLAGNLVDAPHGGEYTPEFMAAHALARAPRQGEYRGFVFASLSPDGVSLDAHLGRGKQLIDRMVDLSPEGEIELSAGWVRHKYDSNWKMLYENDTDGYHVEFTHVSFLQAISTQVADYVGQREAEGKNPVIRAWGDGHTEIDFATGYRRTGNPFEWFGRVRAQHLPNYVEAMEKAYGKEVAQQRFIDGPPHAIIFPNLFLAELSIVVFEPVAANRCVQWHCPVFFKGAPEVNKRMIRQAEGALGPGGFLIADDQIVAERNQQGLLARNPQWLDLTRGLATETDDPEHNGVRVGEMVSELTNRAFWTKYKELMLAA